MEKQISERIGKVEERITKEARHILQNEIDDQLLIASFNGVGYSRMKLSELFDKRIDPENTTLQDVLNAYKALLFKANIENYINAQATKLFEALKAYDMQDENLAT
jgi:hypothetical protein